MARSLRIEYEGAVYHVTSCGNAREDLFLDDEERGKSLEILGAVVERFNRLCHAYCLMRNHYHPLIETPDANLSQGMGISLWDRLRGGVILGDDRFVERTAPLLTDKKALTDVPKIQRFAARPSLADIFHGVKRTRPGGTSGSGRRTSNTATP